MEVVSVSADRHSFVAFYPSDWIGGTARMTRLQRSIYFDVCCYNWDKAVECPATELPLMLGDIENWQSILELLIAAGKLYRTADGSVGNTKAMLEAKKAYELWRKKSTGGKNGANKTNGKIGDGSGDGTPNGIADGSGDGSARGVSAQNQNQNQNQKVASSLRSDACPQPSQAGGPPAPPLELVPTDPPPVPFVLLPTNAFATKGEEVPIFQADIEDYARTYPVVNVGQQLLAMRRWLIDNYTERKTAKGMKRFVNSWLSREQDKGQRNGTHSGSGTRRGGASGESFASTMSRVVEARAGERVSVGASGQAGSDGTGPITAADRETAIDA